ncbi:AI-2E family transporter [Rhodocaloribacter litoris]|uniref:AI-2E family transporter n=1 Tax=Rhodocaloribacter litoris TaxID=2558931 RepID=UPI00141E5F42|nr:AI-2E family transporter [Rhodocaloribacter litoris]QXD15773.1 AI-2E family transporter [Rhodocaloribacter litoris]GIV60274.1 MAG: UPF0118 membrane protein [Rhodothermaceae bacterium]
MRFNNLILIMLGVIVVFIIGVILLELRAVLLPFVIALLLSMIFKPIVVQLQRRRVPMAVSLMVVLLTFSTVLFLVGLALYATIDPFVEQLPYYQARLNAMISGLIAMTEGLLLRMGIAPEEVAWRQVIDLASLTPMVTSGVGTFISFVSNAVLVLLFMLFILAGSGGLSVKVRTAFPDAYASRIAQVIVNVDRQVRQYLITKTLISLGTGALTWLVLLILGVDFPLIWGFIAFLLNYIPNIGSMIAVLFPFVWSLLQFETFTVPLLVLLLLGGVQMIMGNVIEPKIMAFSLNLSPLLVLMSLIFWGWLWGIWGMVLAVPLTGAIKIFFENVEPLAPLSVLMSEKTGPGRGAYPPL